MTGPTKTQTPKNITDTVEAERVLSILALRAQPARCTLPSPFFSAHHLIPISLRQINYQVRLAKGRLNVCRHLEGALSALCSLSASYLSKIPLTLHFRLNEMPRPALDKALKLRCLPMSCAFSRIYSLLHFSPLSFPRAAV